MPLKVYCPSCSEPNEYTLNKPIFCSQCGSKMSDTNNITHANKISVSPSSVPVRPVVTVVHQEEPTIPAIEINEANIGAEIEAFGENAGVPFEQALKQSKTGFKRVIPKKVNVKKTIADFQKESRPKTRDERELETIVDVGAD